jgi:ADP-ribose pyrophosphatase YjhB (NUDIX family)
MKNFPIKDESGKEYWISRAVTVVILVIAEDDDCYPVILAIQRSENTPDPEYVGCWCLPCGYVDYDETIAEAAARELFEETGLEFNASDFKLVNIMDKPDRDKRQNITFRYILDLRNYSLEELCNRLEPVDKSEVSNTYFIPLWQIPAYKWAFNHEQLCQEILNHDCLQDFPN